MSDDTRPGTVSHLPSSDVDALLELVALPDPEPDHTLPAPTGTDLAAWAEWYHRVGYRVGEDRADGVEAAAGDPARRTLARVLAAWTDRPNANIALRLGPQRNPEHVVDCLDADGAKAARWVQDRLAEAGILDKTPCCIRRNKDGQVSGAKWFLLDPDPHNRRKTARLLVPGCANKGHDGLELLAMGGKATVPPSVRASTWYDGPAKGSVRGGESRYEWHVPLPADPSQIPTCPPSILALDRVETVIGAGVLREEDTIRSAKYGTKTVREWRAWMTAKGIDKVGSCWIPARLREGTEDVKHTGALYLRRNGSLYLHDSARHAGYTDGLREQVIQAPVVHDPATHVPLARLQARAGRLAERLADQRESKRLREYVDQFADRVAKRQEAAAIYDRHPEVPRTPEEQALAEEAQDVLTQAQKAVTWAREMAPEIRAAWKAAGLVHRHEGCGGLPQGLADYSTGQGLYLGRVCGRDDCAYCGPWRVALRAGAVLHSQVLDADGHLVGDPMGSRDVWLFRIERARLRAWQDAFGREIKIDARKASAGDSGTHIKGKGAPCTGISRTLNNGSDSYVVFDSVSGDKVTVLSTRPLARSRVWGDAGKLVPRDRFERVVRALVAATYRVEKDEVIPALVRVRGAMRASHGLHLDPETVTKRAHPHGWVLVETRLCSPREARDRLSRDATARTQVATDGVIQAIHLGAREVGEWESLWGRLRPESTETVVHTEPAARVEEEMPTTTTTGIAMGERALADATLASWREAMSDAGLLALVRAAEVSGDPDAIAFVTRLARAAGAGPDSPEWLEASAMYFETFRDQYGHRYLGRAA